ncbi:MAG: hypothetical protein U1E05_01630 [Patescibacteria group bacterium]|nr:hypothetical protein [Patescibacteria group bacterium]
MHENSHRVEAFETVLRRAALCAMALLTAGVGCRGNYPATVPVHGRITCNGGAWPGGGNIYFLPEKPADAHGHHPGMASFGPDGTFSAQTFVAGDGLGPGTYVVRIECWKVQPQMGGPPPESHVPSEYLAGRKSPPKLVIEPDAEHVWYEYDMSPSNANKSAASSKGEPSPTPSVPSILKMLPACPQGVPAACVCHESTPSSPPAYPF